MYPVNFDSVHSMNVNFIKSFIDLKVVGYKSYADSLNTYTSNFFKRQLDESKDVVAQLGDNMKKAVAFGVK